ncbi:MAG TPA: DUF1302 domain-containing protein, partial [Alphaproteobacteria bacterium]|nr:DUF1302 domain-containing protein [Alphaproteobacteria bacterium]
MGGAGAGSKRFIGRFAALGLVLGMMAGRPAGAFEVYGDERLRVQLDTTLSLGSALRVESRDDALIYRGNDPDDRLAGTLDPFFTNADDGNLNYDKGDVYSVVAKSTFDLEIDYALERRYLTNLVAFVRATAFYDFFGNCAYCTRRTPLSEPARDRSGVIEGGVVGSQFVLLDAYGEGLFDLGGRFASLRFGNQVLSWGESLFIPGGVSSTNAFDVTKLRIPGSELKEAFVPAPIVRVSSEIVGSLSMEAYYQFDWNRTHVDPLASYWSTNDLVGRGRSVVLALNSNDPGSGCTASGTPPGCVTTGILPNPNLVPRSGDDTPSDQGQWGVAARYFFDRALTEVGVYYMRYHSKTPVVGLHASAKTGLASLRPLDDFFRQYPDDIDLVGFSFNTAVLNAALAGEISYRPNDPTPIVAQGTAVAQALARGTAGDFSPFTVDGFVREKRLQAQMSLISTLGTGSRMGIGWLVDHLQMDNVAFTSEIGVTHYPDLGPQCPSSVQALLDLSTGSGPTPCIPYAGVGPADPGGPLGVLAGQPLPRSSGVDATSWGYSFLILAPYTNPLGVPITLTPSFGFSHDFSGTAPNQTFIDGRKAVRLGLEVDYLGVW